MSPNDTIARNTSYQVQKRVGNGSG